MNASTFLVSFLATWLLCTVDSSLTDLQCYIALCVPVTAFKPLALSAAVNLLLLLLFTSLKYHIDTDLLFANQVCLAGHETKQAASLTSCAEIAAAALCAPTMKEAGSTGLQQHAARLNVITAIHCSTTQRTILFITQMKPSSQIRYQ
jgi:hypothetical protein